MSREVLDSRSSYDEPYDDRPAQDHSSLGPRRPRLPAALSTKLRSASPLLVAFAVGLAVGGAGWNEWLAQRDAAAARSTVSFTARMSRADATPSGIEAYVRLTNTGPEAVQLVDLEIDGMAVVSSSRQPAPTIEVLPGREVTSRLHLRVDCRARGGAADPTLTIRVRTIDGTARSSELPLEDDNNWLNDTTMYLCPDPNDRFLPLDVRYDGASSVVDVGGPALRMPVSVTSWTPMDFTVLAIRAATRKLSVSVEGLPLSISRTSRDQQLLTVTWRVDDCRGTGDLRFEEYGFFIDAQRAGGEDLITAQVQPDPNMALDVANFVATTCRAA